jgi:membrane-bound serine protease (ClpP class)
VAAYARSLAAKRGRDVDLAERAVTESRSFTEDEALKSKLIDLIASDRDDLIRKLDGRSIVRFDGRSATLRTSGAVMTAIDMTLRQQILSAIAHPQIAYLLFTLGTLGLTIELWNPGAVLPGVAGGLCLLLAFFAFQVLPINYAGLLLMLFGLVLLALEIKVTSFGLLAVGGVLSLVLGSMMLVDSTLPELQISLSLILPLMLAMSGILIFLARIAYAAQMRRPVTGEAGMLGEKAVAVTPLGPERAGQVATHGELWRAVADQVVNEGETVLITAVEGLTLRVTRGTGAASLHSSPT